MEQTLEQRLTHYGRTEEDFNDYWGNHDDDEDRDCYNEDAE